MDAAIHAILYSDLVGSTALTARIGDERARDMIRSHYEQPCEEAVANYHGRIFKRLGDGILADFGSARQAVQCAREIHRRLRSDDSRLKARIGITVGEPVEEAGDFFGTAVNTAQRAASIGREAETVVSAGVVEAVGQMQGTRFLELAPKRVKGLPAGSASLSQKMRPRHYREPRAFEAGRVFVGLR